MKGGFPGLPAANAHAIFWPPRPFPRSISHPAVLWVISSQPIARTHTLYSYYSLLAIFPQPATALLRLSCTWLTCAWARSVRWWTAIVRAASAVASPSRSVTSAWLSITWSAAVHFAMSSGCYNASRLSFGRGLSEIIHFRYINVFRGTNMFVSTLMVENSKQISYFIRSHVHY